MTASLLVLLYLAGPVQSAACSAAELTLLARGQQLLARGDDAAAREALDTRNRSASECALLPLATLALTGWSEARALAPAGGAAELLGPVRQTLQALEALGQNSDLSLEVQYATTTIQAAIAAAQDERPEMELLLTHARDLSERLAARGKGAIWPRPFNLVAGELWFEVDRYDDARAAYERAVRGEASASALIGLARAQARLEQFGQACATYKRVQEAAPALRAAAARDLARCR
jgi:tetratricopeptide (TPR) repeat protein